MNTMTVDAIELDGETVDKIERAAGQSVAIHIVMTTPRGHMVSLTAHAANEAGAIRLELPGRVGPR